jgi:predicted RNA-binding protein YlqC (UPF0109 family)
MEPITIKTQRQMKVELIADYLQNLADNPDNADIDFEDVATDIINLMEED